MEIDIRYDSAKAIANFTALGGGLTDAVRDTLNDMAWVGAQAQRAHLRDVFTLRNKWVYNSIWPKYGQRRGFVPPWANDLQRMYSRTGSVSPLLEKQEEGFSKKDPSVPSRNARISRSNKRVIRGQNRLNKIDKNKMLRSSTTLREQVPDHRERVSVLLAVARAINWKGIILIEEDSVLPEGYYQRKGNSLLLLRRNQKGTKRRRAIKWHEDAIEKAHLRTRAQHYFNSNARKRLSGLY